MPGVLSELLSVLFPVHCVNCGRGGGWLCPACLAELRPLGPGRCRRCGRPSPRETDGCPECRRRRLDFARAEAAFYFEGPARRLVHRLKYSGQRRLAGYMADLSAAAFAHLTEGREEVTLSAVPLHSSKMASRGYNQAAMYARALARRLGLPHHDLLRKDLATAPQNRLDFHQRRKNLVKTFSLRPGATGTGRVILVDDVFTTGSTADECAGVLKRGLGVEVYVWTFARTVRGVPG